LKLATNILTLFGVLELVGVALGLVGLYVGVTKGRDAIKFTGGGVVGITVKYLLIATALFIIGFSFKAFSFLADMEFASVIGSVIMFGEGVCFFLIFKELAHHMEQLKSFT
jgi:hypothetical protein